MWLGLLFTSLIVSAIDASRVVCYYTNWAQYRNGKGKYTPADVDPNLCTHIMYAFAAPSGVGLRPYEWNDDSTSWATGMYQKMTDHKSKNPNLKILLAIGGYNAGSSGFSLIVQSQTSRSTFAKAVVKFLRSRNFDGFDLDWEYPAARGSPPQDKQNFVSLMQELMNEFQSEALLSGKPRLLLTGAFPAGKDNIDGGFNLAALARSMDFINLMTYDLHGSWEKNTGIHSPLYAHTKDTGTAAYLNLEWVAQYYVSKGVPKDKMVIGLATYGRSFTLDDPNQSDVGAPASQAGQAGKFTGERGFISYYEICEMIQSGARVVDVPSQRSKYVVQGQQWVGYDDIQTITEKACYAKQNGFGGVMFWALDLDDFKGQTCGQGRYPLITAAANEMNNPSLANCARKTPNTNPNPNPNPGSGFPITPRPTIRPYVPQQPNGGQQPQAPTGFVPINPPVVQPVPTNPPVTRPPFQPVTNQPALPTRPTGGSNNNPFAFTLPTFGKMTPHAPPVTFLTGAQTPQTTATSSSGPTRTKSPFFDCVNKISDFYPDPVSCDHFYICANQITYRVQCALGLKYNIAAKYCDWSYNVNCQGRYSSSNTGFIPGNNNNNNPVNQPTPAPTQAPHSTTAVPAHTYKMPLSPNSNPCAGLQNGYRADPSDCKKFFQCQNGVGLNAQCPSRLVFNPKSLSCDFAFNVPGCP